MTYGALISPDGQWEEVAKSHYSVSGGRDAQIGLLSEGWIRIVYGKTMCVEAYASKDDASVRKVCAQLWDEYEIDEILLDLGGRSYRQSRLSGPMEEIV